MVMMPIVIVVVTFVDGALETHIAGHAGQLINPVHSAFHAEVSALDWATEYLMSLFGGIV